ncbi:MAG: alkaline phosphatase [Planctomycetota bacterium]
MKASILLVGLGGICCSGLLAQAVDRPPAGVLSAEFEERIGEVVTGTILRVEGDAHIIDLGRNVEGILPQAEKARGESYNTGARIRVMVLEVKEDEARARVILTRAHKDLVRALFRLEVPEIAAGSVEIRGIEREPGDRTKVAVHSSDDQLDSVGVCLGERGTRVKSIIDELNGERIDIIRWSQDPEVLITNALRPVEASYIKLDARSREALVLVDEDQPPPANGDDEQNVRLASRLTGWEINITTRAELDQVDVRDPLRELQVAAIEQSQESVPRVFWFGDQGGASVYSTSTNHSNRLVPAVLYSGVDGLRSLTARRGVDLQQRGSGGQPQRVDHLDQTQLHVMLGDAVTLGAKRIIVLLLDGCDWQTYAAASVAKSGTWDPEGYGTGLAWFDASFPGVARSMAPVITSPLRGPRRPGGYDPARGGRFPWSTQDATYLRYDDPSRPRGDGPRPHAVADSAATATSIFSGVKTTNGRVNTLADGTAVEPLGRVLQRRGFAVATVTDVPFDHASPAAVYGSCKSRSEYAATLGPQMLGLREWPGPDVVLGYGFAHPEQRYLSDADLEQVQSAQSFQVVTSQRDDDDRRRLADAAAAVAQARRRGFRLGAKLFGFFGTPALDHAPYRTADGRYDPTPGIARGGGVAAPESYGELERDHLPRLVDLARAAMTVLDGVPEQPFLLSLEAGLVDWALHGNNVDHAIGEVLSAEEVFDAVTAWVSAHGWWHETVLLVTSDHGHLMYVDLPALRDMCAAGR